MSDEFHHRKAEIDQDLKRQQARSQKHETLETYNIEQGEAHAGHIPDPRGTDAYQPKPTLWERIKKRLNL